MTYGGECWPDRLVSKSPYRLKSIHRLRGLTLIKGVARKCLKQGG